METNKMTLKDMIIAVSGLDDKGMPKGSLVLSNEFLINDEIEVIDELVLESPELQMYAGDGFIVLDMKFGSKFNVDLSLAYDLLEDFRIPENSIESSEKIPLTRATISPVESEGQYFLVCLNPIIHCLTAEKPNAELTMIRMTFLEDNCLLYENQDFIPEEENDFE